MIRFFLVISFLMFSFMKAQDQYLNIDADFFEADEKKQKMFFEGNVKMTKQKDILTSNHLLINTKASSTDENKQVPKNYVATGNVQFTVHTADNTLVGRGDKIFYYPDREEYVIVGNGYLEDQKEGKKVSADKIYINEKTGYSRVDSTGDKPVKFRIKLDEKKQTNDTKEEN